MTPAMTLFFGLTLTLTVAIVSFTLSLRQLLGSASPFPRAAIVPVLTPVHTWRVGARVLSITLGVSMSLYALLWIAGAASGMT